jgi:hypothetical protein
MNTLIFTGAGFTNPLGLPITSGFKKLINNIPITLKNSLSEYLTSDISDIEHVLSTLERFTKNDSFSSFLIERFTPFQNNSEFQHVARQIKLLKGEARKSILEIKQELFTILESYKELEATLFYVNFIKQFEGDNISFFTTNYDLTFESAIESKKFDKLNREVNFGFTSKRNKNFFDVKYDYEWDNKIIEYKKLHGSLDWIIDKNKQVIKSGATTPPQNPELMPLLYPGYKDTPTDEPFKTIHDQLLVRLLSANKIYIIGYAFRDNSINNIFDTALKMNKEADFFCFNPMEIDTLPKESKTKYFKDNYENFEYIQEGIRFNDIPLDFSKIKKAPF